MAQRKGRMVMAYIKSKLKCTFLRMIAARQKRVNQMLINMGYEIEGAE